MGEREEKIKFIETLLDFVNADLEDASPQEKMKWSIFFWGLMGPLGLTVPLTEPAPFPTDEDWKTVLATQESWNMATYWLVAYAEQAEVCAIYYEVPRYFTWGASSDSTFSHRIHPYFEMNKLEARIYDIESLNNTDFYGPSLDKLPYTKREFPPGFLSFLEALSGFPHTSIKSCLHCNRLFFTPNNLRKVYHSAHCQKVASVYRSRRSRKLGKGEDG
ncbi:MAG: hypothetical protein ACLQBD_25585 [Syntrophobacteraceae bacterium]